MIDTYIDEVVDLQASRIEDIAIDEVNYILKESETKLEVGKWYSVPQAVAVFADMEKSTEISFRRHPKTGAKVYEMFTGSWISILDDFKAGYIDIKGDGGFGLFYGRTGVVQALAAAVTFQTAISRRLEGDIARVLNSATKKDEMDDWSLRAKIGIHKGRVLVKRIGRRHSGGSRLSWMVWAGKPVNYASKLSGIANGGQILATNAIIDTIESNQDLRELLYLSCGCPEKNGKFSKVPLWSELNEDHKILFSHKSK
ncbi:adenylate/guanylate cyclase domain-containing protein [Deinococcus sp. D7000]|nr:adenylate/guanylate cyclase domain-containing protein [Deinococcus sp. D7000]